MRAFLVALLMEIFVTEVVHAIPGYCEYNGMLHTLDEKWYPDPCKSCECLSEHNYRCRRPSCPYMECKTEKYVVPGECCPRCRGFNETGEDCYYLGRLLKDGDIIIYSDSCNEELKCYNGTVEVTYDSCTYMECETETYMLPGDCCPRCRGHDRKSCNVDGELFQHGEKWIPNSCASCECLGGSVICRVQRRCSNAWFYNNPTKRRRNTNPCVERNGGCDHYCEVENGRAKCYCHEGFHQDGRSCNRLHACQIRNGGCQHNCHLQDNVAQCSCLEEYILQEDGKSCVHMEYAESGVEEESV